MALDRVGQAPFLSVARSLSPITAVKWDFWKLTTGTNDATAHFPISPFELSRLRGGRYAWVKLAAAVLRSNCLASVGVEV